MKRKVSEASLANLKPFPPGVSGNPNGRPKGTGLTGRIRAALDKEEGKVADALVKAAIEAALNGDFRFWQEIINRVDGKVADKVTGEDGGPVVVNFIRGTPPAKGGDDH